MVTTDWLKPASAFQGTSTAQNVSNALVGDGAYATLQHYAASPAYMGLRFAQSSLPGGVTITKIEVRVTGYNTVNYTLRINAYGGSPDSLVTLTSTPGVRTGSVITVTSVQSAAILAYAAGVVTMRVATANGSEGNVANVDLVECRFTYTVGAPPTVTAITPAKGPISGGTQVEIEGTLFHYDATVAIGGVAATDVSISYTGKITCVTGAHAAGVVDVVVTNAGGSGTLASGYTYLSIVDANVRLVDGGTFTGDDKADVSTEWPGNPAYAVYGAADDLWGIALTPAKVNAVNFGAGIAGTVGTGAEARVSHMEMEVHYSVPGVADPQTYLAVLKVAADKQTAYPAIYQLPRAGYTIATDPSISKAVSGASLFTSRVFEPARYIEKIYHSVEFWADISPSQNNTAGLQVWAYVENGTGFQLFDSVGVAATLKATGPHLLYFPRTDAARGKFVQLEFRVPALTGDAVESEVRIRNIVVRFDYRPERTEQHSMPLNLGRLPTSRGDASSERRSPYQKLLRLAELAGPGKPPVQMRDALGRTVYILITDLTYEEISHKLGEEPSLVAHVTYRQVSYA